MRNRAVVAEAGVTHAAAITDAFVAANPVGTELVIVCTSAEGCSTHAHLRTRSQALAKRGVIRDRIVVYVDVQVVAERQLRARSQVTVDQAGAGDVVGP